MNSPFLLLCRVPGFEPARIHLQPGLTIIGRSKACNLCLPDETVSRQHAEIRVQDMTVSLRDLGSLNGTFLAGKPLINGAVRLAQGQQIWFGTGSAKYRLELADLHDPNLTSDDETVNAPKPPPNDEPGRKSKLLDEYKLTPAQRRVLDMILDGHREKKIAELLNNTQQTVHTHVREIYRIFNVHSRAELMALFVPRDEDPSGINGS